MSFFLSDGAEILSLKESPAQERGANLPFCPSPAADCAMSEAQALSELESGRSALIVEVGGQGPLRRRLLDMGLTPGTRVTMLAPAPSGDPLAIHLRRFKLSLRREDAGKIIVRLCRDEKARADKEGSSVCGVAELSHDRHLSGRNGAPLGDSCSACRRGGASGI